MKAYKCRAGLVCLHRAGAEFVLIAHYGGRHEQPHISNDTLRWSRSTPHAIRRLAARAWRQTLAREQRRAAHA